MGTIFKARRMLSWGILAAMAVATPSYTMAAGRSSYATAISRSGGSIEITSPQRGDHGKVTVHRLSNGMEVWLSEDHTAPAVMGMVVVRAGAKDCPDTGIAHYFEHMMFKGTDKIGTTDWAAEKPLLDSIAMQYALLKWTADRQERANIQSAINALSIKAAAYAIPNEFSNLTTLFGGSMLNAGTSYDYTMYYNLFSPHNMEPWLELNSERLVSPVFRMFQSELETVYEEKNMHSDFLGGQAVERALEMLFAPHPYAKPVIGSTENLKNPDLDAMRKFYEDYYVAGNMALILNGDFNTDEVLPLAEKYFSRIKAGNAPKREFLSPRPFSGREQAVLKLPIPLIKAGITAWRTVPVNHPDEAALNVATTILNNSNGTGFLDKLMKDGDVMAAGLINMGLNDTGLALALYVPKSIVFGLNRAEEKTIALVDRLRKGDFTDEEFQSAKLEYVKDHVFGLENFRNRASTMAAVYASGMTWDEYLAAQKKLLSVTREEVASAARKYLGDDKLVISKKTGSYDKDKVESPGFDPVKPQTKTAYSEYARKIIAKYTKLTEPRFIDPDKDVARIALDNGDKLFVAANPYNDIFTLTISYRIGMNNMPSSEYLGEYLDYIGTDSMSSIEFQDKLRALGTNLSFGASADRFNIKMSGFDANFAESYRLLKEFILKAVPNRKGLDSVVKMRKMEDRMAAKEASSINDDMEEFILYGNNSSTLRKITAKNIRRHKKEAFLHDLNRLCSHDASIYYSGTLPGKSVAEVVGRGLIENADARTARAFYPVVMQGGPAVYVINSPKTRQSRVNYYIDCGEIDSARDRALARLFNMYVGGSMNSVMFRELREYRSFAYSASSSFIIPNHLATDHKAVFACYLTTQLDKTADALATLDSLMANMEFNVERFESARIQIINDIHNGYPSFRAIGSNVDRFMEEGYEEDPRSDMYRLLTEFTTDDLRGFYDERVKGKSAVVAVTTDTKRFKPDVLSSFGKITILKLKQIQP